MTLADEIKNNFVLPLWNNKSFGAIDKYVAPNADIHTTFLVGIGPEAMRKSVEDTFKAFPVFELTLEEIVQNERKLSFKWSATVVHEGAILNLEPTGKKMVFSGIVYGEVNEQKQIIQYHSFSNIPQVLYANVEHSVAEPFPARTVLLDHENYEKEIVDLLFSIVKLTGVRLTRREAECLNFWLKGYSIKETARQLGDLSVKTVQVYRDNIRIKFNVSSYQALFDLAQKTGVLALFLGSSTGKF